MKRLLRKKNFQTIIRFYLFECPVQYNNGKKVSAMGKTFNERRLGNKALNTLKAAMCRCSRVSLSKSNGRLIVPEGYGEYLIIKERSDISVVNGYFYAIRNAFAHGMFSLDGEYYLIENWNKGELKAIGRLKEKTLLRWIELCDMDVAELKEV